MRLTTGVYSMVFIYPRALSDVTAQGLWVYRYNISLDSTYNYYLCCGSILLEVLVINIVNPNAIKED